MRVFAAGAGGRVNSRRVELLYSQEHGALRTYYRPTMDINGTVNIFEAVKTVWKSNSICGLVGGCFITECGDILNAPDDPCVKKTDEFKPPNGEFQG